MDGKVALITGFEPYGGRGVNPASEVVKRLDGTRIRNVRVVGRTWPVSYRSLRSEIDAVLEAVDPLLVLSLGLWPGEPTIRLERIGVNVADFEIPDNDGTLVRDRPLDENAPTALMATLPLREIEQALIDAGVPARVSNTAGTFLCNATLYGFLEALSARGRATPSGFLHLPYLPDQVAGLLAQTRAGQRLELHQRADLASMHLETMVEAVGIAVETTLATLATRVGS